MDAQLITALFFLRFRQPVVYLLPLITKGRQDRIRLINIFYYISFSALKQIGIYSLYLSINLGNHNSRYKSENQHVVIISQSTSLCLVFSSSATSLLLFNHFHFQVFLSASYFIINFFKNKIFYHTFYEIINFFQYSR